MFRRLQATPKLHSLVIIILLKFLMVSVSFVSARQPIGAPFSKQFGGLERHSSWLVAHITMIPVSRPVQLMHRNEARFFKIMVS